MDEIKKLTFEVSCKMLRLDPKKVIPDFPYLPTKEGKAMAAHLKCVIMVKAANKIANGGKEWTPKYGDNTPVKYEPWWKHEGGSHGFRYDGYDHWHWYSVVGSRLCFFDYETMISMTRDNKEYIKTWNQYANNK